MNISDTTRVYLVGLLLCLLVSSCGESATAIRLEVRFDEVFALTDLELHSEMVTRSVPVTTELLLLVPEDWAGGEVEIRVDGFRSSARVATGRVSVTPVVGAEVTGIVTLTGLACGAWCTPDSTTCDSGGVQTCVTDVFGCPDWGRTVPCGPEQPSCSIGRCAVDCIDECVVGEQRCAGPRGFEVCGQDDTDTCLDWQSVSACGAGTVCSGGQCVAECADECDDGAVTCRDAGVSTCGDTNADGCTEWGPSVSCDDGASCSEGLCTSISDCTSECEIDECTADGRLLTCGNFDLDSCLELSSGTSCAHPDPCVAGRCAVVEGADDTCVMAPRICEMPAAPTCIDDDTRLVFDANGTCRASGECDYPSREVPCANCPSCDICAGVECTNMNNVCLAETGTCNDMDGQCSFESVEGECDDGNACTELDTCTSGVCLGTTISCMARSPECSGSELQVFGSGICTAGICDYSVATTTNCPDGCASGACVVVGCPATCPPDELASVSLSGVVGASGIVQDATHVYWREGDAVQRREKATGTITTIMTMMNGSSGIALDDTHIYWTDSTTGQVSRRLKSGGIIAPLATDQPGVQGIAVDDTHVYWTNFSTGLVWRAIKTGGTPEAIAALQAGPSEIAVDADFVYWIGVSGRTVRRRSKTNPTVIDLATAQGGASGIALDADHIYWTNFTTNQVMRATKAGDSQIVFAENQTNAYGIVLDADYVYWVNATAGLVQRKAKAGGTIDTLATGPVNANRITVDATYVYWTTPESVMRVRACGCGL